MPRTTAMKTADNRQRAGAAREHLHVVMERLEIIGSRIEPSAEAQVAASNSILAGIAAADAICGSVLGERANDQDHRAAIQLLATVMPDGPKLSAKLRRLLTDKTLLQYGGYCTPAVARSRAKDAQTIVEAMSKYGI